MSETAEDFEEIGRAFMKAYERACEDPHLAGYHPIESPVELVQDLMFSVTVQRGEIERLKARLNTPELEDFAAGVVSEAQHQRERWGEAHDAAKSPEDWFWTLGYLAGKALAAARGGDPNKLKHHLITSAGLLGNWHAQTSATPEHGEVL